MAKKLLFSIILALPLALPSFSQSIPVEGDLQGSRNEFVSHFSHPVAVRAWEVRDDSLKGWLNWKTVENFSFGKDRGNLPMIADLNALHPYFRDRVLQLINLCKEKGIQLEVVETYRTHAKQREYKMMGRRYTRTPPGYSRHQYGLAVDVVPVINNVPQWNNYQLWRKVGLIGEKLGFRWGGRWRYLYDPGHFEWGAFADLRKLSQGQFPPTPVAYQYPCLEEDLRLLRLRWKSLDAHQDVLYEENRMRIARKESITRDTAAPGGKE